MKLKTSKKFTAILTSILATFAVYTSALLIFLYVQGWRIDFLDRTIKQVGVLTVESSPTQANIYVDDEYKGRTTKSTTLDVGTYSVKVTKSDYYDWSKEIDILEEKSTPIFPYLIRTQFDNQAIFQSELKLENYWFDKANNHLLILVSDETTFELMHYSVNSGFWAFNSSPLTIFSVENDIENPIVTIDLILSPSGEKALLNIITETTDSKYVIPTNRLSQYSEVMLRPLSLSGLSDYLLTWSKDENYLILESDNDVLSYDLEKNSKNLLYKKTDPLDIWSTDEDGYFYIFRHNMDEQSDILSYTLEQYNLDGSGKTVILPVVYFQNNIEYINNYRNSNFDFGFFTNSPESTQTIGNITSFSVHQEVLGIYIKTTQASYWYDTSIGKYLMVSVFPADILQFSLDQDKILIKTDSEYSVFLFDKEEGDHTVSIGTHAISNLNYDLVENINWLSNSSYFQFEEDGVIYIADIDGENKTPIISTDDIKYWTVTSSRDNLITLTSDEFGLEISSYTIH
jgi:hypothetical protein